MMKKKTVRKTARRFCWVKKDRTSVWLDKFLTNEVPESEWRDNFCMSKRSFYELKNYTCFSRFTCISFIYNQKGFACRCDLSWTTAYKITKDREMEVKELVNTFLERHGFLQRIGAIDGTHIETKEPNEHYSNYINRKT